MKLSLASLPLTYLLIRTACRFPLLISSCGIVTAFIPFPLRPNSICSAGTVLHEKSPDNENKINNAISRQSFITNAFLMTFLSPKAAKAACLTGDQDKSCIGIYKVPNEEIAEYAKTPEELAKIAPDLRWVPPLIYPKSLKEALEFVEVCDEQLIEMEKLMISGKLEDAGVLVLGIIPKITVAGSVIIRSFDDNTKEDLSMRSYRVEVTMTELLVALGGFDVTLGQGMRGEMGAITAAQVLLLSDVRDVKDGFELFKRAVGLDEFKTKASKSDAKIKSRKG